MARGIEGFERSQISIQRQEPVDESQNPCNFFSGVRAIFVETSVNERMIRTHWPTGPRQNRRQALLRLHGRIRPAGETYLSMMRENVLTIVEGLK
jgi:hypothetical protein